MSSEPLIEPIRVLGFFLRSKETRDLNSRDASFNLLRFILLGDFSSANISFIENSLKGVTPVYISKRSTPKDHQSIFLLCPLFIVTSGATYSGVPHIVKVFSFPAFPEVLLKPKSVSLMWPSESTRIFSGLRSL